MVAEKDSILFSLAGKENMAQYAWHIPHKKMAFKIGQVNHDHHARSETSTVPNIRPLAEPPFPHCTLPLSRMGGKQWHWSISS